MGTYYYGEYFNSVYDQNNSNLLTLYYCFEFGKDISSNYCCQNPSYVSVANFQNYLFFSRCILWTRFSQTILYTLSWLPLPSVM